MIKHIPNTITLINAFCGCLCIVSLLTNQMGVVPWLIGIAMLADFLDGFVARLLKVSSPVGRELDSMADMVTVGVVPGVILYSLINMTLGIEAVLWSKMHTWLGLAGFLVTVFAALRLAMFNVDTRQSENFIGLNTPATTLLCTGLLLIVQDDSYGLGGFILQLPLLLGLVGLLSFLLVAEIPIFSLKFKGMKWGGNEIRWSFILVSFLLLLLLKVGVAAVLIILIYLLASILLWMGGRLKI